MKGHNGHHQLAIGTPLASQVPIQVDESEGGGASTMGLEIGGALIRLSFLWVRVADTRGIF